MNNMKKRYVIYFTGLFERGYVRPTVTKKTQSIRMNTEEEALSFAKKYRFEWWAKFACWMCNMSSKQACDLRTYTVKEIEV